MTVSQPRTDQGYFYALTEDELEDMFRDNYLLD